jgi:hypothetical protein
MTKATSKPSVDNIVSADASIPAQLQPRAITLIGTGIHVLQQATVLIRQGWMPDPNMPPLVFGAAGTMQIHLIVGTPAQEYVNAAAVLVAEAADIEHAQFLKAVEVEAKRQIASAAKQEADRQREALLAEQRQKLADLEASFAVAQ